MNWKKILALAIFLAVLATAIAYVNHREKGKMAQEGILLDIPAASIDKIELMSKGQRFVFSRSETLWFLEEPLAAKADKVVLENILDNFCRLKYDRLVEEDAKDLKIFGLDKPEIELKLFVKGKPAHTILLGMKNSLDESSYVRLAAGGKVVTIAAYKRSDLEKDLFAFRDKKFLDIDTMAVTALDCRYEDKTIAFSKKNGRWFMEKPVYSLAQDAKVSELLSSASMLAALAFTGAASADKKREFGLEKPLLAIELRSAAGPRKIAVGKKGERYYALADGVPEICEIAKDFPEKFAGDPAAFREKKVAVFYAFDVRELSFQRGPFTFKIRKDPAGNWEFAMPVPGKKPGEEKISRLLTALADCEAKEFIDGPKAPIEFTTRIVMKTEDPAEPGKRSETVMEFSAAEGETVFARNPELPYGFRVGKEILDKLPAKIDEIIEENPQAVAAGK